MTPNPSEETRKQEDKPEVPADVRDALRKDVVGKGVGIKQPTKMVETKDGEYPMCEKLAAMGTEHTAVREFLEWAAAEHGLFLDTENGSHVPSDEALALMFIGVDQPKLEKERQEMLDKISA